MKFETRRRGGPASSRPPQARLRQAAELCGWSVGWVSTRYQELRDQAPARPLEGAAQ